MEKMIAVSLSSLALVSACTDEMVFGPNGDAYRIVHAITFNGVDAAEDGLPHLSFTLTNTTADTLCFFMFSPSRHYGRIDYFLADGSSYVERVSFSHWNPDINQPFNEGYEPTRLAHEIRSGQQFEIERILTPSVYESEAGVNMIAGTNFAGAFIGQLDLFAQLEVNLHKCEFTDPNLRVKEDGYLFTSGTVGPFRVDIPASR